MALLELGTPVPIRFFSHPSKVHFLQRYCRGMHEHHIHYAHDKIPPIFFVRDTAANASFPVSFINLFTGEVTTLTPTFTIVTVGTRDYCFGPASTAIPTLGGLACGKYRMQVADGASTYYSEHFNISDQTTSMLKWSWSDTCARFGVPWQGAPGGFRFHFYVDGTIGAPVDTTEEDVFDNGTEQTVTQSRTARRTLFQELIPDFLVDCFHAMHHHGSVQLTVPVPASTSPVVAATTTVHNVKVHDIATAYGRRACMTETSVYFEVYADERSGCCDGELVEEECYPSDPIIADFAVTENDGTWFEANASAGQTAIVKHAAGASGSLAGHEGEVATWDGAALSFTTPAEGSIYSVTTDHITGLSPGRTYVLTGAGDFAVVNTPEPIALSVFGSTVSIMGASAHLPYISGRFVRITAGTGCSLGELTDPVVVAEVDEASFAFDGVSFSNIGDAGTLTHYLLQVFNHNCNYNPSTPCQAFADFEEPPSS